MSKIEFIYFSDEWNEEKESCKARRSCTNISGVARGAEVTASYEQQEEVFEKDKTSK